MTIIENQGPADYISAGFQCSEPEHFLQKKRTKYAKVNTDTAHYLLQKNKRSMEREN